jgi:uncharacterized membrane protein YfcA
VPTADLWWAFMLLGLAAGALGTLVGAGGGFILVPILLMMMPKADPVSITAISLSVVFFNASSGSIAYLKMGRVDLKSAAWFALATFPGALIGAYVTRWLPRYQFNLIFGGLLLIAGVYLVWRPEDAEDEERDYVKGHTIRRIKDAEGTRHLYTFPMPVGLVLSVFVGFFSSLLGIGGGIIHVPVLNRMLNFPVHIATTVNEMPSTATEPLSIRYLPYSGGPWTLSTTALSCRSKETISPVASTCP